MRCSLLALLPLLAACGQGSPVVAPAAESRPLDAGSADPGPVPDPAALLGGIPAAAAAAGSVVYAAVTEGGLDGEPAAVEARTSGVLDTTADAGTAALDLVALDDLAAGAAADGEQGPAEELAALARLEVAWTATEISLVVGGERRTAPRDAADTSMIARLPSEPAGLFDVVAAAGAPTVEGREDLDGVPTTHLRATARPAAAAVEEVWVDDAGRPARIRYTVVLPSLQQGRSRTMVTTYDYTRWGQPVDVTP